MGTLGPDDVANIVSYNNLSEVTLVETYASAGFISETGEIDLSEAILRAKSESNLDAQGRVYHRVVYEVDPITGTAGNYLTSNIWYNPRGMVMKTADANGLFLKSAYDGAGRTTDSFTSFDSGDTCYGDADDVTGDTVIEQSHMWYNLSSEVVASASYQRLESDVNSTGELNANPASSNYSYVTGSVFWYDLAGRLITSATVGRDAGDARYLFDADGDLIDTTPADGIPDVAQDPPLEPDDSDNYIATETEYRSADYDTMLSTNAKDWVVTTDNRGQKVLTELDLAGRTIRIVENLTDGVAGNADYAVDRVTEYEFDIFGRLATLIALNPKGQSVETQKTRYLYESPRNASWVTATVYPDSDDGLAQNSTTRVWSITDDGTDHVSSSFDYLGRQISTTDQRGVVHSYSFDSVGRLLADAVSVRPELVDGRIMRIERTYDDIGRLSVISSYNSPVGGDVLNEIAYSYDGWGNVVRVAQAHDGAVTTGTPEVLYTYEDGAVEGKAKYVRLDMVTYPDGLEVCYNYPEEGVGAVLSRLENIAADDSGTEVFVRYTYLGAGTIVTVEHPEVTGGLTLSYGAAGTYGGWDRFGRIIVQNWTNGAATTDFEKLTYTYDHASNRTAKVNVLDGSFSESYAYDGLNRLTATQRDESNFQAWDLDALGNWAGFNDAAAGLNQDREHNAANEVVGLGQGTGQAQWIDPVHDAAGNMTEAPVAGQETRRLHLAYDAWNRLAGASWDKGGEAVAWLVTYTYDPAGRRIVRQTPVERQDLYYNEAWQVVEVRRDGQEDPLEQWVWDSRYVDAAVVRFYDANTDGDYGDAGDNVLYPIHDANWNVTGVVDAAAGGVAERYVYTPYGTRTVLAADWSADGDGLSGLAFANGHQGGRIDLVTGYIHFRHREYCASLGRWLTRDPLGYVDGMNVYEFVGSTPVGATDPMGLAFILPPKVRTPDRYALRATQELEALSAAYTKMFESAQVLFNAARAIPAFCSTGPLLLGRRIRELSMKLQQATSTPPLAAIEAARNLGQMKAFPRALPFALPGGPAAGGVRPPGTLATPGNANTIVGGGSVRLGVVFGQPSAQCRQVGWRLLLRLEPPQQPA